MRPLPTFLPMIASATLFCCWGPQPAEAESYDGTYQGTVTLVRDSGGGNGRRGRCAGSPLGRPWSSTVSNGHGVFRVGDRRANFLVALDGSITSSDDIGGLDLSGSIDHGPVVNGPLQWDGKLLNGPTVTLGSIEISGSVVGSRLSLEYESQTCTYRVQATRQ